MARTLTLNPQEQAKRRRRARINQQKVANLLRISLAAISKYETGKEDLPWELTPEDYEHALDLLLQSSDSRGVPSAVVGRSGVTSSEAARVPARADRPTTAERIAQ